MIILGASGTGAALPFSLILTATGAGVPGHVWNDVGGGITDQFKLQLSSGRGTYSNTTIARIIEVGGGNYEYQLTAGEAAALGKVYYYPNVALHDGDALSARWEDIVSVPTANSIRDAILDTVLDTGRTIRGFFRRKYALDFGKVIGLNGALVTAHQSDNTTPEYTVVQDLLAGTRQSAGSE